MYGDFKTYIIFLIGAILLITMFFLFARIRHSKTISIKMSFDEDRIEYIYPNGAKAVQTYEELIFYDENGKIIQRIKNSERE